MSTLRIIILIFTFLAVLQSCKPTRHVKDGQFLVVKNKIHINDSSKVKSELKKGDFYPVIKQKSNRKLLFLIPFNLSVWNYAHTRNQDKKRNQYLLKRVGEAPVIFEPVLLNQTKKQMTQLLENNGYFDGTVATDTVIGKKLFRKGENNRKIKIHYYINTKEAYRLRRINYALEDTSLLNVIDKQAPQIRKPLFTVGSRFQLDKFDAERSRITNIMKDLGYYTFDPIHVLFDIDTNLNGNFFNVSIRFRNQRISYDINGKDSLVELPHVKYRINKVIINEDYTVGKVKPSFLDSIELNKQIYLFQGKPIVRPSRLSKNIFVNSDEYFSRSKTNYTYSRLNSLGTFKFIDLKYEASESGTGKDLLDLRINLTKAPKQSLTLEGVGTNRSGNLGISTSINFRNRNVFRGAEQLDFKLYGGVEAQRTNSNITNDDIDFITRNTPFNTYEAGTQVTLTIPDLLFKKINRKLPWFKEPKTNIIASADRQVRPQFDRTLVNLTYQIVMRIREKDQLSISPVDLSVIQLDKDADFERQLQQTQNSLLINSYNNHIIPAGKISYSNTTQSLKDTRKNYHLYKVNFELAGNLARSAAQLFNFSYDKENDSYLINKIAFSHYIKSDAEYTKNISLRKQTSAVYRGIIGVGIPLTNLNTLPFERSFFAGGSNDMRAWQARALGPGSLSDTATFGIDQVGEFKLELNLEYRFNIFKQLEGAMFMDVGNIWLLQYDPQRPGAEFQFKDFYKEFALGPGAGLRFNFGFFVLRLDGGLQLRDPSLPLNERWLFQPKTITNENRAEANETRITNKLEPYNTKFTFNLGIGYPF